MVVLYDGTVWWYCMRAVTVFVRTVVKECSALNMDFSSLKTKTVCVQVVLCALV